MQHTSSLALAMPMRIMRHAAVPVEHLPELSGNKREAETARPRSQARHSMAFVQTLSRSLGHVKPHLYGCRQCSRSAFDGLLPMALLKCASAAEGREPDVRTSLFRGESRRAANEHPGRRYRRFQLADHGLFHAYELYKRSG